MGEGAAAGALGAWPGARGAGGEGVAPPRRFEAAEGASRPRGSRATSADVGVTAAGGAPIAAAAPDGPGAGAGADAVAEPGCAAGATDVAGSRSCAALRAPSAAAAREPITTMAPAIASARRGRPEGREGEGARDEDGEDGAPPAVSPDVPGGRGAEIVRPSAALPFAPAICAASARRSTRLAVSFSIRATTRARSASDSAAICSTNSATSRAVARRPQPSRLAAISRAVANRRSGTGSRPRITMSSSSSESDGITARGERVAPESTRAAICDLSIRSNRRRPVSISQSTTLAA